MTDETHNPVEAFAGHSQAWRDGRRNGVKWAIEWLQRRADQMNDQKAVQVLNSAQFCMGVTAKKMEGLL